MLWFDDVFTVGELVRRRTWRRSYLPLPKEETESLFDWGGGGVGGKGTQRDLTNVAVEIGSP